MRTKQAPTTPSKTKNALATDKREETKSRKEDKFVQQQSSKAVGRSRCSRKSDVTNRMSGMYGVRSRLQDLFPQLQQVVPILPERIQEKRVKTLRCKMQQNAIDKTRMPSNTLQPKRH